MVAVKIKMPIYSGKPRQQNKQKDTYIYRLYIIKIEVKPTQNSQPLETLGGGGGGGGDNAYANN